MGGDGKDARGELVAGSLLEERGVLLAMQEVLVGDARPLELHDLALLPVRAELHRETRHCGARREVDRERALEVSLRGVLEGESELGEGERRVHYAARAELEEAKPGPVARGEGDGRLGGSHGDEWGGSGDGDRENLREINRLCGTYDLRRRAAAGQGSHEDGKREATHGHGPLPTSEPSQSSATQAGARGLGRQVLAAAIGRADPGPAASARCRAETGGGECSTPRTCVRR